MKPSQTLRGQSWLGNFEPAEVRYAELLMDSLRIAGTSEIRNGIKNLVTHSLASNEIRPPSMLVAARKMNEFGNNRQGKPIAFSTFSPAHTLPVMPGSEGLMGSIIRDLVRTKVAGRQVWLPPDSSLESLRKARCRSIVLLSDYSGSGSQLANFAMALKRNPTIRSWVSAGNLTIHAVVFSASTYAAQQLSRPAKGLLQLHQDEMAPDFEGAMWSDDERRAITDLCVRYAERPKKGQKSEALGYKQSKGLFATDATIPNNLPVILRQQKKGWKPFFEGRVMPADLAEDVVGYRPRPSPPLETLDTSFPREQGSRTFEITAKLAKAALVLIHAGSGTPALLSSRLGLKVHETERVISFLERQGMVSKEGKITPIGVSELQAVLLGAPRRDQHATLDVPSYYPLSLR